MSNYIFSLGDTLFTPNGVQYRFGMWFWTYWPRNSGDDALYFLRNVLFHNFQNVSWHSMRQVPVTHSTRYAMLKAIVNDDIEMINQCLDRGWDINAILDIEGKFNAASLAAHLDKLEILHYLDMRGADINSAVGKHQQTPLMTSMMSWNVRIIDYLMERGVDPFIKDSYGFTALRKAQIKQFRTISSMLQQYEQRFQSRQISFLNSITTDKWHKELENVDITKYKTFAIHKGSESTSMGKFKPSDFLTSGTYPFSNLEDNSIVFKFINHNFIFFRSGDEKLVA
ncbi:myotrophin [Stylonychia lemnae]|uniref:Myotrophin n=1 Tax=Stylonychia lemnae TaxID=5949 RepID=A0A078AHD7_STYLE|nr:myotrophin [Stylonychia lemnae]|eukprot:CDW80907.1 myotrophin [Stylonychia lemnae]